MKKPKPHGQTLAEFLKSCGISLQSEVADSGITVHYDGHRVELTLTLFVPPTDPRGKRTNKQPKGKGK